MLNTRYIFSREHGNVVSIIDPIMSNATLLTLEGWGGYESFKAIITSIGLSKRGNFQFLHTLGGAVYVYVFGGRIGEMQISGLAFDYPCYNDAERTGAENVLGYFDRNNLVTRKTPLTVTIGYHYALKAYLTDINIKTADPKDGLYEFTLSFAVPPPPKQLCLRYAAEVVATTTTTNNTQPEASLPEQTVYNSLYENGAAVPRRPDRVLTARVPPVLAPLPATPTSLNSAGNYTVNAFAPETNHSLNSSVPEVGLVLWPIRGISQETLQ